MQVSWRGVALACAALAALALLAPHSQAATISDPSGPLIGIHVSSVDALDCQVQVAGVNYNSPGAESDGEFWGFMDGNAGAFPHGINSCGTFLRVAGVTYGPDAGGYCMPQFGPTYCPNGPPTPFTPVSQSTATGSGAPTDPWTVVTSVKAGPGGLVDLVQTDQYVSGMGYYTTTIQVSNGGPPDQFNVYRAGDCYLEDVANGDSGDSAFGLLDAATSTVACTLQPNVLGDHFIALIDTSATTGTVVGQEDYWNVIWNVPGSGNPMAGTCLCPQYIDNGVGLSWSFSLAQGGSATLVTQNGFVPIVVPPVPQPPVARFSFRVATNCIDPPVAFADLSTDADDAIVSWAWAFGDASTSTLRSPTHAFAAGTYTVTLTVTDASGLTGTVQRPVVVPAHTNCCPSLGSISSQMFYEGTFLSIQLQGFDPEGRPLTYSVATTLPHEHSFDPTTGLFGWASGAGDAGRYALHFTVTDGFCTAEQDATVRVMALPLSIPVRDIDLDGIEDSADLCPAEPDHDQTDSDRDGVGNACDATPCGKGPTGEALACDADAMWRVRHTPDGLPDTDHDGIADAADDCPAVANHGQDDLDGDSQGDVCDGDIDGDGVPDMRPAGASGPVGFDNCPRLANRDQADRNGDGIGDLCQGITPAPRMIRARPTDPKGSLAADALLTNTGAAYVVGGLVSGLPLAIMVVQWRRRRK